MRTLPRASALAIVTAAATLNVVDVPESRAAGDPASGHQLLQNRCADCHLTPSGVGGGDGPSLDRLSRERSFTPDALGDVMATDPHDRELRLSQSELRDISAYLNAAGTQAVPTQGRTDHQTSTRDDAADSGTLDQGQRAMPLDAVVRQLGQQGYNDIREVEREGPETYEVYARDPDGRHVELKVDAITGKVLYSEDED